MTPRARIGVWLGVVALGLLSVPGYAFDLRAATGLAVNGMTLLGYNVIQALMVKASQEHGRDPRRLSFKGALQTLQEFAPGLRGGSPGGLSVGRTAEAEAAKCLVDDTERQAGFGGIAPSDADLEATA